MSKSTAKEILFQPELQNQDGPDQILWIVYKLRKRLRWPCDGIQFGKKPVKKKTIDTMEKELEDDGEFCYCINQDHNLPKARYNPYDIVSTEADIIKTSERYYTVSATYVTMVSMIELEAH